MSKLDKLWYEHALLREGERLTVYKDTLGKPTVGIGHLVLPEDNLKVGQRISKKRSREFFELDSAIAKRAALAQAEEIGIEADWFVLALISVNFQLGISWGVKKFKHTYSAIKAHDFDKAIKNLRKSLWYKQTPVRVEDFIHALERAKEFKKRPVTKTRSIVGAGTAGISVIGSEVADVAEQIEPLAGYSDVIQTVFIVLALAGIALAIYARLDDRKQGKR